MSMNAIPSTPALGRRWPQIPNALRLVLKLPPHVLVALSGWLSRAVTVMSQLVVIVMGLRYLGTDGYALIALLVGLQGWASVCDMGIGTSLQNFISESRAHGRSIHDLVVFAQGMLHVIIIVSILAAFTCSGFFANVFLKGLKEFWPGEKNLLTGLAMALYPISAVGQVGFKMLYADQKGFIANAINGASATLVLILLCIFGYLGLLTNRIIFFLAITAPPSVAGLTTLYVMMRSRTKSTRKNMDPYPGTGIRSFVSRSARFWLFGILCALVLQIDYPLIARYLTPHDIVIYSMTMRLFNIGLFFYSAFIAALHPVCAELAASCQWKEIRRISFQYLAGGMVAMACFTCATALLINAICSITLRHNDIRIPRLFIIVTGAYFLIRVWTDQFSMLLQSMSCLHPFWLVAPFQVAATVILEIVWIPRYGIYGAILALIVSFSGSVAWALPMFVAREMRTRGSSSMQRPASV